MSGKAKMFVARQLTHLLVPRLLSDDDAFNRLLGEAANLQFNWISDDSFRETLQAYYASVGASQVAMNVGLDAKRGQLNQPGGYKADIMRLKSDESQTGTDILGLWRRRFALLRHLRIRSDVLILRRGEQIPPHAHRRVVSGFYVLEGEVGIRHYDVVSETQDALLIQKALDFAAGPGDYGTNSDNHQNVHWLCGLAERSYLFRLSVTGTPVPKGAASQSTDDRMYIDPTQPARDDGCILAPIITEAAAKKLPFLNVEKCAIN